MSWLLGNEYLLIPMFGLAVFITAYTSSEKVMNWLHQKSLGNREEVMRLMDAMFIDVNKKKVTMTMLLSSFGIGALFFLALWPNVVIGFIMGTVVTVVGWSIPPLVMKGLWEKRCDKFVNQMVDGLTIMGNGIKAGLSIPQALERVVENLSGPIAQEFSLVLNKVRLGMSVEEALNELGERVPRQDVQMLVTAINILKETGGNLAETFATIVMTIRERQKIEKKIQALTAQGMMQGVIITLVPFVLLIIFFVIDPNYIMPLFTRPMGWVALALMLTLQVIGGVLMKKIVTIKV